MQIGNILSQIDLGAMALPEFQRGYVWNRDQVRELMNSLYRRFPVGSLLIWKTRTENANAKGDLALQQGYVDLILDGQQRITTLYGVIRGKAPKFYERQRKDYPFLELYFNVDSETFKFYSPLEMKDQPLWISVTELMQHGIGPFVAKLQGPGIDPLKLGTYITRLSGVHGIQTIDLHIEQVTGDDKTIDVVVDIFNKVNSGGTKLSKGDLALARVCAAWPDARDAMHVRLEGWGKAGFYFDLDWLMRNITTVTTGQPYFTGLANVSVQQFQDGLKDVEKACNNILTMLSSRLGLDHDRVLGSRYAFPVMARYIVTKGGHIDSVRELNQLLYFYIHAMLWGRYAGSTESALSQDLNALAAGGDALENVIGQVRRWRGDLSVRSDDFSGNSLGARFYPMLYLLTRVCKARDWGNGGLELNAHMLGKLNWLQVHHIFPKAQLYRYGYSRGDVNALANFCFLTQQTNLQISDRLPEEYFVEVEASYPVALASQWVPMDPELWKLDRYKDFLAARRELLAKAANDFLDSLVGGSADTAPVATPALEREAVAPPLPGGADEEEMRQIRECNGWIADKGLPRGDELYELSDPQTGAPLAIIDLAWPRGLQEGLSQPVALLLNEGEDIEELVNQAGYKFFTDPVVLCAYIEREVLSVAEVES